MAEKPVEGVLPTQVSGAAYPSVLTEKTTMDTIVRDDFGAVDSSPPSEQDLPAIRGTIPHRVWLIQGLVFMERAAFYGASQPFRESLCIRVNIGYKAEEF